jgi:hypothetical protein
MVVSSRQTKRCSKRSDRDTITQAVYDEMHPSDSGSGSGSGSGAQYWNRHPNAGGYYEDVDTAFQVSKSLAMLASFLKGVNGCDC